MPAAGVSSGMETVRKRRARSGKADRSKLTPYRVALRQRETEAIEMRIAGVPLDKIAERLGWTCGSSASKAIRRALEERAAEPAEHLRQLEVERLDRMLLALWPAATTEKKWLAVDRILKIMERKSILLGLDAPQRRIVDVITHDGLEQALEQERDRIAVLEKRVLESPAQAVDVDLAELDAIVDAEVVVAAEVVQNDGLSA